MACYCALYWCRSFPSPVPEKPQKLAWFTKFTSEIQNANLKIIAFKIHMRHVLQVSGGQVGVE